MDKNELLKLYYQKDKEFEAAKGKRMILTLLFFVIVYYALMWILFGRPDDFITAILSLLPVTFFAAIHLLVNATIFGQLHMRSREETEILERIRKEISELEKNERNP